MEKLEQEMNAPEKMAETPSPKKTAGKKKKFRKNQVIITARMMQAIYDSSDAHAEVRLDW